MSALVPLPLLLSGFVSRSPSVRSKGKSPHPHPKLRQDIEWGKAENIEGVQQGTTDGYVTFADFKSHLNGPGSYYSLSIIRRRHPLLLKLPVWIAKSDGQWKAFATSTLFSQFRWRPSQSSVLPHPPSLGRVHYPLPLLFSLFNRDSLDCVRIKSNCWTNRINNRMYLLIRICSIYWINQIDFWIDRIRLFISIMSLTKLFISITVICTWHWVSISVKLTNRLIYLDLELPVLHLYLYMMLRLVQLSMLRELDLGMALGME